MGPTLLLDKSIFQSLSALDHEALRRYFVLGLHPILADEILGDLSKVYSQPNKTGEGGVAVLARKFLGSGPPVLVDHFTAIEQSLLGFDPPMTGQLVVLEDESVGRYRTESGPGFVVGLKDLNVALMRWKDGAFTDAEKFKSVFWRKKTTSLSYLQFKIALDRHEVFTRKASSYEDALAIAENESSNLAMQPVFLDWLSKSVSLDVADARYARARLQSFRYLRDASPYAYFCLKVMMLLYVVTRSGLLKWKPTNAVDARHLFYLPFCKVFSSSDDLHLNLAPLLVRKRQMFIPGKELKADITALHARLSVGVGAQIALYEHHSSGANSAIAAAFERVLGVDLSRRPVPPRPRSAEEDAEIIREMKAVMSMHKSRNSPGNP
jgi:hypothetical protein